MKKFNFSKISHGGNLLKFDLRMKITTLLLIVSIFQLQAIDSYSQNTKITLKLEDVTIEDVFRNIEAQSEFTFLFNHNKINTNRKVSVDFTKTRISEILESLFSKTDIYFKVRKKQIILKTGRPKSEIPTKKDDQPNIQQTTIEGTVTDASGIPLPGVNILVVGTNRGTQTDFDGKYSIEASDNEVLRFSYVGFKTVDVTVGVQANYSLELQEDASELDEVVVVGYGTEIKRNLTSSVSTVDAAEVGDIPATSLSNALAGRIAGVQSFAAGGRPGNTSSIRIRGASTGGFGGTTAPLYVIDNIIATKQLFDLLDANEVESVSVLKDAAATAVYGSRASNGVILVTTKSGKKGGKPVITFNTSVGTSDNAIETPHTTAYEHAILTNRAIRDGADPDNNIQGSLQGGLVNLATQEELDYLRGLGDIGNFEQQSKRTPITTRYALNVTGGSENVTYFLGGSYVREEGIVKQLTYDKFNIRGKVAVDITENLNVSLNTDLAYDDNYRYYWPFDNSATLTDAYRQSTRRGNWAPAYINGLPVANFNAFNVSNFFDNASLGTDNTEARVQNVTVTLDYKVPFIEGLTAGLTYNRREISGYLSRFRKPTVDYFFEVDPNNRFRLLPNVVGERPNRWGGAAGHSVARNIDRSQSYQINGRLNYDRTFGDHNVKAQFIYEQFEFESENVFAQRNNPISDDIRQLFATSTDNDDIFSNGGASESGRLSYVGSVGYSFKNRYFLNASFRNDGSTNFPDGDRYGLFPALSGAWVVSDENFFGDGFGFINFMKLRASWGKTGSDAIGGFQYLQGYNLAGSTVFGAGNTNNNVISPRNLPALSLTWDKTESFNYALDLEMFENRLSTTIEVFKNKRTDLFSGVSSTVPTLIGSPLPPQNFGAIDIKGFEVVLNYKNSIGDFKYNVGANLTYAKDKRIKIDENPIRDFNTLTGFNSDRIFGYRTNGIIRTQEQLDALIASGYTTFGNQLPHLGAILYEDVRGNPSDDPEGNTPDGIIDGNDRTWIADHSRAPVTYGLNLGLEYKGLRVEAFIQGAEGHKIAPPQSGRFAFDVFQEGSWAWWNDAFHPVDNPNGSMPRFVNYWAENSNFLQQSEFWLRDGGFARLKNLNISYSIPQSVLSAAGIKEARIYANGTNLFMIYSDTDGQWDPELSGSGIPLLRTYSLGLQLTL